FGIVGPGDGDDLDPPLALGSFDFEHEFFFARSGACRPTRRDRRNRADMLFDDRIVTEIVRNLLRQDICAEVNEPAATGQNEHDSSADQPADQHTGYGAASVPSRRLVGIFDGEVFSVRHGSSTKGENVTDDTGSYHTSQHGAKL